MDGIEEQKKKDWEWYFKELMGEECLCERSKKSGHAFCYRDFKELPGDLQKVLYRRIGNGYEEAFEDAVNFLEVNVW